jgi:predicted AAA+ superfamily ATPase
MKQNFIKLLIAEYQQKVVEIVFPQRIYTVGSSLTQQLAVQVSYSLQDVQTRNREIQALLKFSKQLDVSTLLIITKDDEETINEGGLTIDVVPVWKWLCGV